ncbi:MAG: carboxymuconolactone decarboxylase [Rhodobacteraceae bacterium]|nr:MAG: carboxymuconolactone decarboxylase [Paracoccaceae bacterium]
MTLTLSPIPDDAWPQDITDLLPGFAGKLNVYRTMAHHPALLRAWVNLRQHLVVHNTLGAQHAEVVILRTGHNLNSAYEWAHHVSRGRACGMSDTRIASISGALADMETDDAILAGGVDELFHNARLTPHSQSALTHLIGTHGIFDVMALVGMYSTLGFIVNSFATPIDDTVADELDATPLQSS